MHRISTRPLTGLTVVGITAAALFTGVTGVRTRQAGADSGPDSLARKTFQTNCAGCHGAEARGGDRAYAVGGRQFVATAASGGNILAFALPDQ